jgi:hypothetical protein
MKLQMVVSAMRQSLEDRTRQSKQEVVRIAKRGEDMQNEAIQVVLLMNGLVANSESEKSFPLCLLNLLRKRPSRTDDGHTCSKERESRGGRVSSVLGKAGESLWNLQAEERVPQNSVWRLVPLRSLQLLSIQDGFSHIFFSKMISELALR